MQKADYMNKALYTFSEWRYCIYILEVSGVKILGLTLKDSGGDGVTTTWGPSDILIKDVICENNYRQGMSPCEARNLTIENCVMINTGGTPPGAGVDFEPVFPENNLTNIKMLNCYIARNVGGGLLFPISFQAASMTFKHCYVSDGVKIIGVYDNGGTGAISFEDCIIGNTGGFAFSCLKSANRLPTTFTNCQFQNSNGAIQFQPFTGIPSIGGVQFVNCAINEPDSQVAIMRVGTVANITGNIKVNCPYGAISNLGGGTNVTLQLTENKSKPPVVANVTPAKLSVFGWGNTIDVSAEAYDPDIGIVNGSGIIKVDFALWRGDAAVATISDASAPFEAKFNKTTAYEQGIYLARVTAYSSDGSNTVDVAPISLLGTPNSSGLTFTSSPKVTVPNNDSLRYKVTLSNTTGSAATFTFLKKPSWVTIIGDSAYGKAPVTPSVDTLIIVAIAGAVKETLKVVITVSSHILIEAESGIVMASMQIKNDPNASGGKCIATPPGTGNTLFPKDTTKFSVNILQAGTYYVWLRVLAPTINPAVNWGTFAGFNGSFKKPGITNINTGRYEWAMGSADGFVLKAGANQFIIGHGNEQVQIDQIIISSSPITQLPSTGINKRNISVPQNINKSALEMNVSGNSINFLVNLEKGGDFTLQTYNISGQKIWDYRKEKCQSGQNLITLNKRLIKNGVYMTELTNNKVHSVVKYVVVE
jgi:hypothetical protein